VECAAFADDVGRRRLELEERQREYDVGYAGMQLDFEIEEASSVAPLNHGAKHQIHHRHHHHRPTFPSH